MAKNLVFKTGTGRKEILNYYDQILNRWPQNCRKQFIKTRYGFTFVIECGVKSKPALILLHGAGSNSAMWTADVNEYSKNYRVFTVDIIGECGKSAENRPDFKSSHYSNWLIDVFEAFQLEDASLVGCSLGGWIAIKFATQHPEKVKQLALISTSGITQIKPSLIFWLLVTSVSGKWGFNKMNKIVYNNIQLDEQTIQFTKLVKQHFIPRTDALPLFTDAELQKITTPVFFMGGENDCFFNSEKTANRLKTNIEQAECKILENTGHVITVSANYILTFLKRCENEKN
ncbi:alpha/beta fold hydrolase [Maribellus maritimus]|uniref:alpha/beta fold hydrolase n=1 Tax=Maribellus maritimus TaxID=2870838 RepID=UPI001EEC9059|nr:alpha/beta hydrolase [Maribellus maritimus]MCG6188295.1 alpha/beta hydrolase [Maribellus maritimus]